MKIKLDENLPIRLADLLNGMGHDADTVLDESLVGYDDVSVWNAVQDAGRFFITQDLDFSDVRMFTPGHHHGLLLVRLREPGRQALLNRIATIFSSEHVENWAGCFVVATDHKVRIMGPTP